MSLSTFQRAVLQEMGIPVWVSQSSPLSDATVPSTPPSADNKSNKTQIHAQPTTEEKQSRLAQLRAQVSSNSANQNERKGAWSSAPSPSASAASNPINTQATPVLMELTQAQRLHAKQWLEDVDVSLAHLNLRLSSAQIKIGQQLVVTHNDIVLPTAPHLLTATLQKQLWKMLCALSSKASQPETHSHS